MAAPAPGWLDSPACSRCAGLAAGYDQAGRDVYYGADGHLGGGILFRQ